MVHVIGDSHASVFTGSYRLAPVYPARAISALPGVRVWHLGAHLAHSIGSPRHPVRRKLKDIAATVGAHDCVLMYFGEIDCRFHVVHQAGSARRINSIARDVAARYMQAARAIVGRGRELGFVCVPPPTVTPINNDIHPIRGTFDERLRAARAFNAELAERAAQVGARVLNLTAQLAGRKNQPKPSFFDDGVHADPRALHLFVRELVQWGWIDREGDTWKIARAVAALRPPLRSPPLTLPGGLERPGRAGDVLVRYAAARCAALGAKRIALYGAGAHTRRVSFAPFEAVGLRVVCIIDDRASTRSILGVPIRRLSGVRGVDAVVVSSDAHEAVLLARAQHALMESGIPVIPIYNWE